MWKKSVQRYHQDVITKSKAMYDALVEQEIIPAMERDNDEEDMLTDQEMRDMHESLDRTVEQCNERIEKSDDAQESKQLRRA